MMTRRFSGNCGKRPGGDGRSIPALVRLYLRCDKPRLDEQLEYFATLPSFEAAVEAAAMAKDKRGKRLLHQRRLKRLSLMQVKEKLLAILPNLRTCGSFEELHTLVVSSVHEIRGLGELYSYDTALRIGAHLRKRPERVYLHAGTRKGARALRFPGKLQYIERCDMPIPLHGLAPHDIENFLCIYEEELRKLADKSI